MIGRLIEDLFFLSRIGYFYYRAPRDITSVGFNPLSLTRKQKFKYAFNKANFKI